MNLRESFVLRPSRGIAACFSALREAYDEQRHPRGPGGKWARAQFEHVASTIQSLPGDMKGQVAQHFASALSSTNPNFRADSFKQAAMGSGYANRSQTPKMSKGHFEKIADTINQLPSEMRHVTANSFARDLRTTNPKFDAVKFRDRAMRGKARMADNHLFVPSQGGGPSVGPHEP